MRIFGDHIAESFASGANGPSLWLILGVVAGVAAITAVLIVILIKKKKGGN